MKPELSGRGLARLAGLRRLARLSPADRLMSLMLAVVLAGIAYLALGLHRG